MFKVRIRGIYSTALTKLLMDEGFDVVQPSTAIQERFGLKGNDESPDLDIEDRGDLQGIRVQGKNEPIKSVKLILQSGFDDVVVRQSATPVNGIYKGLIKNVDTASAMFFVDIGPVSGRLPKDEVSDANQKQVVVQIEKYFGANEPLLTTRISLPGKYAILLSDQRVMISRKIRDPQKQSQLLQLGKELATPKWGILWRTASENQPFTVLKEEVNNLKKQAQILLERAAESEAPSMLREGDFFMEVEFPNQSKEKLDHLRKSVAPTLEGHHYYKACGRTVSSVLDMAEKLLERGSAVTEVEELFKQTIDAEYPRVGSIVEIDHVKLDGNIFHLGRALIEAFNEDSGEILLRRDFERDGIYDGLGAKKESGDYALTRFKIGDWHLETRYFSKDGKHKGTYININTPIELYPYGIRYVDLEVDVCIWPSGEFKTLDGDKLEKAVLEGMITEKLVGIVEEQLQEIKRNL